MIHFTKVRICPNCERHNPPDSWNCIDCGRTLSIKSIVNADDFLFDRSSQEEKHAKPEAQSEQLSIQQELENYFDEHEATLKRVRKVEVAPIVFMFSFIVLILILVFSLDLIESLLCLIIPLIEFLVIFTTFSEDSKSHNIWNKGK